MDATLFWVWHPVQGLGAKLEDHDMYQRFLDTSSTFDPVIHLRVDYIGNSGIRQATLSKNTEGRSRNIVSKYSWWELLSIRLISISISISKISSVARTQRL